MRQWNETLYNTQNQLKQQGIILATIHQAVYSIASQLPWVTIPPVNLPPLNPIEQNNNNQQQSKDMSTLSTLQQRAFNDNATVGKSYDSMNIE